MITLLHGDNQIISRNTLQQIIKKEKSSGIKDLVKLDGEKVTLTDLKQALESQSLFGSNRLVVIENIFSRIKSKEKDDLVKYIKTNNFNNKLIIWEKKSVHPSTIRSLPKNSIIRLFKTSPTIFKFIDSIRPGNTKQMLISLQGTKIKEAPELIFYMLSRRISDLIVALDLGAKGFEKQQAWQKSRLISQAKNFTLPKLLAIHSQLFKIDTRIKTGKNILPLSSQLDLIVSEI